MPEFNPKKKISILFLIFILITFSGCFKFHKTVSKNLYSIIEIENPELDNSVPAIFHNTFFKNYKGLSLYSVDLCFSAVSHRMIYLLKYENFSSRTDTFFEMKFVYKHIGHIEVKDDNLIIQVYDQGPSEYKIPLNEILETVKNY